MVSHHPSQWHLIYSQARYSYGITSLKLVAGVGFEPHDLQRMRLTSYLCYYPAIKILISIVTVEKLVKNTLDLNGRIPDYLHDNHQTHYSDTPTKVNYFFV